MQLSWKASGYWMILFNYQAAEIPPQAENLSEVHNT